jgi:hypothetical protein
VGAHDFADDREAQAGTFGSLSCPARSFEDPFAILRWDPTAPISDGDARIG